jgi:hypothetical protein
MADEGAKYRILLANTLKGGEDRFPHVVRRMMMLLMLIKLIDVET